MLQRQTSMAGSAALLRLRLLYRMLRVGELLALAAFVSWSSSYVPSAVAAALRLAGSLLLNARFVFVLGNAIVLLLFALSRHEHDMSISSSSSSDQQPATLASTATASQQQREASSVQPVAGASFASFATPTTTVLPSSDSTTGGAATSFATPAGAPPPSEARTEDKQPAARVNKAARAPRRSRSEKLSPRLAAARRAASPELRRCESENGRRRRSSVTARDAEACSWGREDADEFRRQVEAFIARQTRFHREESMSMTTVAGHCKAAPAFSTGALAVVE